MVQSLEVCIMQGYDLELINHINKFYLNYKQIFLASAGLKIQKNEKNNFNFYASFNNSSFCSK